MSAIFLNHAGCGCAPPAVQRRMIQHLEREIEIGPENARAEADGAMEEVRRHAARLLSADPARIGFASTTCMTWAALMARLSLQGRHVLVDPHEWMDNIHTLSAMGAEVEMLPELDLSTPDLAPWQAAIRADTAAICVPMVTSCAGLRYPVAAIGALPRPPGCRLIVDAAQAVGQIEIAVETLGCDALVATARKWLRGPRQSALYWLSPAMSADIGLTARAFEPDDTQVATRLGLGVALAEAGQHLPATLERLGTLAGHVRQRARALGLDCLSAPDHATTITTLAIPTGGKARIAPALAEAGITIKWPDPSVDEPGSALAQRFAAGEVAPMRVSPHVASDPAHIDALFDVIGRHL